MKIEYLYFHPIQKDYFWFDKPNVIIPKIPLINLFPPDSTIPPFTPIETIRLSPIAKMVNDSDIVIYDPRFTSIVSHLSH